MTWLAPRSDIEAIIHMGANSSTLAVDGDEVIETNFRFSLHLLDWCTARGVKFLYASSASTYGDGGRGFDDDLSLRHLQTLRPLNLYGWSKHLFDQVVATRPAPRCRRSASASSSSTSSDRTSITRVR
jgi:ADP-L-glycero-D-manno-heptose 6-epimerase